MEAVKRAWRRVTSYSAGRRRAAGAWLGEWRAHIRTLEFWLTFAAYAVPLAFLLYVLYINYLPFGYSASSIKIA